LAATFLMLVFDFYEKSGAAYSKKAAGSVFCGVLMPFGVSFEFLLISSPCR